jgi:hypothetical protein
VNNVRCEISRTLRTKKREYLKEKIKDLKTNSKNKNVRLIRGLNEFKEGYQPKTDLVKDENDGCLQIPTVF